MDAGAHSGDGFVFDFPVWVVADPSRCLTDSLPEAVFAFDARPHGRTLLLFTDEDLARRFSASALAPEGVHEFPVPDEYALRELLWHALRFEVCRVCLDVAPQNGTEGRGRFVSAQSLLAAIAPPAHGHWA